MGVFPRGAPLITICHSLQVHQFLVIRAIVPHDEEQWNRMMRRSPESAWRVHHVAVVLHFDDETAVFAMRKGGTDRRRRTMTQPAATGSINRSIMRIDVPERSCPSRACPVLLLDDFPQFRLQPSCADRTGIPTVSRIRASALKQPRFILR